MPRFANGAPGTVSWTWLIRSSHPNRCPLKRLAGLLKATLHMPDIEAKLKFLQAPETYGDSSLHLECIETHMSWVFLVDQRVFKLKKPVCFPFLDFSTLKAREFYCREEVRLNARLAPG